MKEIIIKNIGDVWTNQLEVMQELENVANTDTLVFRTLEGPSMHQIGLIDFIETWISQHQHPRNLVKIKSINTYEHTPFENIISHHEAQNSTWNMSAKYWTHSFSPCLNTEYLFGLFIGRRDAARNSIMYQCYMSWHKYFLLSQTNNVPAPEPWCVDNSLLDPWLNSHDKNRFIEWYNQKTVSSIDKVKQQDQFNTNLNTNASLLEHYCRFGIELVCETCTLGTAFFPTEKIVRPIVGLKPFLVYATKNYLKYLKGMGYQTFDSVWSEHYDSLEGPARWQAIKQVIQNIIDNPQLIEKCRPIIIHNKQCLQHHLRSRQLL